MKTFREVHIQVKKDHTADFIAAVDKALNSAWNRKNDESPEHDSVAGEHVYYVCEPTATRPRALLAIFRKNEAVLYVSNIVPAETSELSYDQYNAILMDFHDNVLRQLSTDFPVTIIASGDQRQIEDILSREAMRKLKQFCGLANKSTGSAHPLDKERWYDFLIQVGNDEAALATDDLRRWLTEVDRWPVKTAEDLVLEFEFALGLLARFPKLNSSSQTTDQGGRNSRR